MGGYAEGELSWRHKISKDSQHRTKKWLTLAQRIYLFDKRDRNRRLKKKVEKKGEPVNIGLKKVQRKLASPIKTKIAKTSLTGTRTTKSKKNKKCLGWRKVSAKIWTLFLPVCGKFGFEKFNFLTRSLALAMWGSLCPILCIVCMFLPQESKMLE